jgi:hypothetical protein
MTAAEAMVRQAVRSKDPALHRLAFEYAFGKVPDKLETTGLENRTQLILHYQHERRDAIAAPKPGYRRRYRRKTISGRAHCAMAICKRR